MVLRTLLFADLFVQAACALALLLLSRSAEHMRNLRWYAYYYAAVAVALLLVTLRADGPEPATVYGARALVLLGAVLLTHGLSEFTHSGNSVLHWGLGLVVVFCAAEGFLLAVNMQAAMQVFAIFFIGQLLVGVFLLLAHTEPLESTAGRGVAALLGVVMLLFAVRAIFGPLRGVPFIPTEAFRPNSTAVVGLIIFLIATACMAFGFVWMATARLRLQLEQQVRTDALTGLLNRRGLEIEAQRALSASRRLQTPLAVVALDLDHFKGLNDHFGHAAGDAALAGAAQLLAQCLRRSDLLARLGGEEFVAVLPARDAARAGLVAERLRSQLEALRIDFEGASISVTASFGVTMATAADSWPSLLQRADAALYEAKRTGRNRICSSATPTAAAGAQPDVASASASSH
ncbi:MAG: GGDEF domain-containing protein [Acidobacteria bacterium]|nr:MAG: GGDEF domain-containing protein [Acidobacteriota bacterium]